ncbi:MAG: BON domain-containing protein [Bacteriovoracia bacterium]
MPRNQFDRGMDRYQNRDRGGDFNRSTLDQGRLSIDRNENDRYLDRDFDLRGSDYGRGSDRDRGYYGNEMSREYSGSSDRNFGGDESHGDYHGYGRDFMTNRPNYNRNWESGFRPGDMRQNDFGTRSSRGDNFRETRWGGSDRSQRGEHFGKGPKGWKRSDERIREEACEALYHDSRIDASDIDVEVKEGTVKLRGNVDSRDTKRAAERCVEDISGVEDVQNELRVRREEGNISDLRGRNRQSQEGQSRSALS